MHYIIVHATDALASKLSVYSGRSSVEHWGGPFSLQRAWPAEFAPEGVAGRKFSRMFIHY